MKQIKPKGEKTLLEDILARLPQRIAEQFMKYDLSELCEIRMVADRPLTLTFGSKSLLFGDAVTEDEIAQTVSELCRGSLHSYEETLNEGYIPLENGCRAGVCGRMSGGRIIRITSVCIRIPRTVYGIGESLCKRLISSGGGMLIYSPPGVGKTTLLRDIAATLSSPPFLKRLSVIDSRCEIFRSDAFKCSIADIYSGYNKADAIELAVRTMSPQYIICDELGAEEAKAVLSTQSFGVPLIATAHAESFEGLIGRTVFKELDRTGIFSTYVGLSREGRGFSFNVTERTDRS